MVVGVILGGIIIGKISEKTFGGEKMTGPIIKVVMRLGMARINMIRTDLRMLQDRRQRAMKAIRAMESVRSKVPTKFRKTISMQISNIKSNVRAAGALMNSLKSEMKFLKSRMKMIRKR